jgi:hypothetical protein
MPQGARILIGDTKHGMYRPETKSCTDDDTQAIVPTYIPILD